MIYELAGLAYVAVDVEQAERAARLLAAVSQQLEVTGSALSAGFGAGGFEESIAAVRTLLSDSDFDAAWSDGRAMSLDVAASFALDDTP
jgi:hypothetical protein